MIRTYGKKLACGLLGTMLVVVAGCQSVGVVDVNQAVANHFKVQSGEANVNVAIELIPSVSITTEQKAVLDKIKNISITFSDIKTQDAQHASYKGELSTARGKIPFQIYTNTDQTIIKVDGAKKPIVFDHKQMLIGTALGSNTSSPAQTALSAISGPLLQKSAEIIPLVASYIARHIEVNPTTISVTPVTETIHSESLSLNKLHTEITGTEAGEMLQKLIANIAGDEKGLKDLLGAVYDSLAPELLKNKDTMNPLILLVLQNKEQAVTFMYGMLQDYISKAAEQSSTKIKDSKTFTDQMSIQTDLYLDSELLTHKTSIEAVLPAPDGNDKGLSAIKVSASSEKWNINKPVTADPIIVTGDSLQMGVNGSGGKLINVSKLLSIFDKQSTAYLTLKEDMQLTRKRLSMTMGQDAGQDPGDSGKPFIKNGTTLVPVRYVVENLDADVKWDGDKKQVTVHDDLSGNEIVFTINNKTALLNGKPVTLETEAIINSGGSTYVPVRFITEEGLGGKIGWDNSTRTVSIARD
jgi:hypothetical protein